MTERILDLLSIDHSFQQVKLFDLKKYLFPFMLKLLFYNMIFSVPWTLPMWSACF